MVLTEYPQEDKQKDKYDYMQGHAAILLHDIRFFK
jgi:hypothetical protein